MDRDELILHGLANLNISANDVPFEHTLHHEEELEGMHERTQCGDLISIPNTNNLGEVLIYRRTQYTREDPRILQWDGETSNYEWYEEGVEVLYIENAEQLAGLVELVENGNTFEGVTIKLSSNINLNYQEWTPIGGKYIQNELGVLSSSYTDIKPNAYCAFHGIFDGCGHTIYGLKCTRTDSDNRYQGLFRAIVNATIKNLIVQGAEMGDRLNPSGGFATLFGYAEGSQITNVIVSGDVYGERVAGIGCIAVDTSFYKCVSRVNLKAYSGTLRHPVAGGIVEQVGLSESMVNRIKGQEPNIFVNCIQSGEIELYCENAKVVWAGQIYGFLAHNPELPPHSIIIERCFGNEKSPIRAHGVNMKQATVVFHGIVDEYDIAKDYVNCVAEKIDLMCGLIGKTGLELSVSIIKATKSVMVDSLVIPGSVNTLQSVSGSTSFMTIDSNPLEPRDGILNLEPCFVYVKTVKS